MNVYGRLKMKSQNEVKLIFARWKFGRSFFRTSDLEDFKSKIDWLRASNLKFLCFWMLSMKDYSTSAPKLYVHYMIWIVLYTFYTIQMGPPHLKTNFLIIRAFFLATCHTCTVWSNQASIPFFLALGWIWVDLLNTATNFLRFSRIIGQVCFFTI